MKTKEEILKILKDELPYLKERYGIKKIGLFGSYSRGEQNVESDVDLLVQFGKPIGFFTFIAIENYLSERIGVKVELVTEDALKPLLKPYIIEEVVYV
ncbi:MAG: nucleotidyltransferase family protein [Thermodesulfobacteriota bacterium]